MSEITGGVETKADEAAEIGEANEANEADTRVGDEVGETDQDGTEVDEAGEAPGQTDTEVGEAPGQTDSEVGDEAEAAATEISTDESSSGADADTDAEAGTDADTDSAEPVLDTDAAEPGLDTVAAEPALDTTAAEPVLDTTAAEPVLEPAAPEPVPVVEPAAINAEPPFQAFGQSAPRRKRSFPWRWVGAVVTMLAVGTGCAFGVMAPQRTELPGLKTLSDGRYDFAPLVLPALAPGQSDPTSSANLGEQHISDIRKLLLSPPKGATADHALPGDSGWVSESATLAVLDNPAAAEQLATDGWRHTAGIAWKTPDGADTKIWLLQFIDSSAAGDGGTIFNPFAGADQLPAPTMNLVTNATAFYKRVVKGSTATWYTDTQIGDTEILIEFTAPTSVGITPLQQELDLQLELLQ